MAYINEGDCLKVLQAEIGLDEFDLEDYKVVPFEEVKGFHGNHALLLIDATVNGEKRKYNYFVKSATASGEIFRRYWGKARLFFKEHVLLTKIINDLQKQVKRKLTAECYLSKLDQFVILENLCLVGYEVSKMAEMDFEHAICAVEAFADLHAASIIYEEQSGTSLCDKYTEILFETFFIVYEDTDECVLTSTHKGVSAVAEKYFSHVDKKILNYAFDQCYKRTRLLVAPSKKYRNVITHGDPWGRNLLYKYNNDDKPKEAILVDFQCQRYVPPAMELMQFFYIGTTQEFRKSNLEALTDIYYERFSKTLSSKNIEVSKIMPKSEFKEACDHYREFGVGARLYYTYVTLLPGEILLKAASSESSFLSLLLEGNPEFALDAFENYPVYRKLLTTAIEDAIEFYKDRS